MSFYTYLPMKMEQTECSETSAYKIQTPANYPKESIQQEAGILVSTTAVLSLNSATSAFMDNKTITVRIM